MLPFESEYGGASHHPQTGNAGQGIDDLFRQAVPEILVARLLAEVEKRKHRYGRAGLFTGTLPAGCPAREERSISTFWNGNDQVIAAAIEVVVLEQLGSQLGRLNADDRIDA